ncbi:MAG: hypothetical protein ACK4TA_04195 [Saprospiraceae bacterium]
MKTKPYRHLLGIGLIALLCLTGACSGTQKAVSSADSSNRTLIDYLRRDPAVRVLGNVDNATVFVNNIQGVTGGGQKEPLFVLNGNSIGYTYNQAVQMVIGKEIESVKVLKSTVAMVQYGEPGRNGAIVIRTRDSN